MASETLNNIFPLDFDTNDLGGLNQPFRLKVQKALSEALLQITKANGFYIDLGSPSRKGVYRGRAEFGSDDVLPFVSILEGPDQRFEQQFQEVPASTRGRNDYELLIQGFVPDDDPDNPTDIAHYLLADLRERFRLLKLMERNQSRNRVFGFGRQAPSVLAIRVGDGIVRPPDDRSAVAYCWLRANLELIEEG